jgi:predicted glycoside hydrolase/deacetylase ChbG (UPF0249 family)
MKTGRREFLETMGVGAAALAVSTMVPKAVAQAAAAGAAGGKRLKMIVRIDDVGYSDVCNIGAFETVAHGVACSCDTMFDTPGTVDAFERLAKLPWITVGWHAHFWGTPVLDPKEVPSMVIKEGDRIRFRKDLRTATDLNSDEVLKECRAQMDRCVKVLGRAPDTGPGEGRGDTPLGKAMAQVCREFGVPMNFASRQSIAKDGKITFSEVDPKWAGRKLITLDPGPAYKELYTDSVTELEKYDPYNYYAENRAHLDQIPEGSVVEQSWHPGYVDYYVYRLGDYGPYARNFIPSRTKDVETLCSARMKTWIKENRIELVNYRDALYGTNEYQNHLREIGSDLYMGG